MKQFRKNNEGLFICEECGVTTKRRCGLTKHINIKHTGIKKYFDKWIKEDGDDECKICSHKTIFRNVKSGYKKTCCIKCENVYRHEKSKEVCVKKYGVKYPLQNKIINEKQKQSMINIWGVNNPGQSLQLNEKKKNTFLQKYNCENPLQITSVFLKTQVSGYKSKKFQNTNIYYRGSYELDFLNKFYTKYPDIQNSPIIHYILNEKNKVYYPDFYIPSLNLIIECKNSYLIKIDKEKIEAKKNAVISAGFKYIIIIDKKYEDFILTCFQN